jgi:hypothetical protein
MFRNLCFFSFRVWVILVFLTSMSGCSRFALTDLLPGQEDTSSTDKDQAPDSQPPAAPQPPSEIPPVPPVVSPQYTWYVSENGRDSNSGTDSAPFATVSKALERIRVAYRSGKWPSGTSAVIVVSGRVVGTGSFGANDSMVDISGAGNYPHIVLKGDPGTGGILDANKSSASKKDGRVLYIANNKVTLGHGLTLTGGYKLWGGGVCVGSPGTASEGEFIVDGGVISGNIAGSGGGVLVYKGRMTMVSGTIKNNHNDYRGSSAAGAGGGVYLYEYTTLALLGGTIEENGKTAKTENGGGAFVEGNSILAMTGGNILRNAASKDGGGVFVAGYGTFNMSGGTISANASLKNGGVGVAPYGAKFNQTGGTISGNTP